MTHSLIIHFKCFHSELFGGFDTQDKHAMLFDYYFLISFLGQSGGMDEELFTKSFEDVPKVQVGLSFLGK